MADEVTQVAENEAAQTEQAATTPDATGQQAQVARMFTQSELDAIVKVRLDRAEKSANEKATKAQQEAEAKRLAEAGEYKKLYEQAEAKAQQEAARAQALELATMKRNVAEKLGLPSALAARLQGDNEVDLETDAKTLMAALPKPSAPNINSAPGAGATPTPGAMTPEQKAELAARYGVNPKYL